MSYLKSRLARGIQHRDKRWRKDTTLNKPSNYSHTSIQRIEHGTTSESSKCRHAKGKGHLQPRNEPDIYRESSLGSSVDRLEKSRNAEATEGKCGHNQHNATLHGESKYIRWERHALLSPITLGRTDGTNQGSHALVSIQIPDVNRRSIRRWLLREMGRQSLGRTHQGTKARVCSQRRLQQKHNAGGT